MVTDNLIDQTAKSHSSVVIDDSVAWNAGTGKTKSVSSQISSKRLVFPTHTETVESLQLIAHGINIFSSYKAQFFRDYMSYTFGGANISTPEDPGAYMLNFCLYPGTYQPSGHINISRAREFYLSFESNYISSTSNADLMILAVALNFLLITDGSAVLRYST